MKIGRLRASTLGRLVLLYAGQEGMVVVAPFSIRGWLVVVADHRLVLPRIDAAGAAVNRADVDGERRKHGAGSGAAVAEQPGRRLLPRREQRCRW